MGINHIPSSPHPGNFIWLWLHPQICISKYNYISSTVSTYQFKTVYSTAYRKLTSKLQGPYFEYQENEFSSNYADLKYNRWTTDLSFLLHRNMLCNIPALPLCHIPAITAGFVILLGISRLIIITIQPTVYQYKTSVPASNSLCWFCYYFKHINII